MATTESYVELLLGPDELSPLFHDCFDESSVDALGYDLRLGNIVEHVITGESKELGLDQETIIYPGETVIVKTEEILHLPDNVYAIGSPKMSLLIRGLWAHGGKTDFGFNSSLTLGFQNVGSSPITIKRCMPIFHLSFFKVHNKETVEYAGRGPGIPPRNISPLDKDIIISNNDLSDVKRIDGIKSYRIMKQIQLVNNRLSISYYLPFAAVLVIFLAQILPTLGIISEQLSSQITLISTLVALIAGAIQIAKAISDWKQKRK